jgi:hypothetical protein
MAQRICAAALALAALVLGIYNAFATPAMGSFGMRVTYAGGRTVASAVVSGGPAALAGIRSGDALEFADEPLDSRLALAGHVRLGHPYTLTIVRGSGSREVTVRPIPVPLDDPVGRYIDLGLLLIYLGFGFAVMLKSSRGALSSLVMWMMFIWAMVLGVADFQATAPTPLASYLVGGVLQYVLNVSFVTLLIRALCMLDIGWPELRAWISRYAPLLAIVNLAGPELPRMLGVFFPPLLSQQLINTFSSLAIVSGVVAGIMALSLTQAAPLAQRVRTRWFVSSPVLCWFFGMSLWAANSVFIQNEQLNLVLYYFVSFSLVGPVYATLRHNLIDLDIVLSRSAIFAAVSLMLVTAFIAAEWLTGRIADALAGAGRWHGLTVQLLSFGAAIAVGLSIRRVHSTTERSINTLIFREREMRLRSLASYAREADLVDSREVLLKLTFETLVESLESPDVALYIADGATFACARTTSGAVLERLDKSDRVVLQLLRRPEPFVSRVRTLAGWLIIPLMARAEIIGFIACGIKPDHTRYLPEEQRALESVAAHVGSSYAMLPAAALRVAER